MLLENIDKETLLKALRTMHLIRFFEEKAEELYMQGLVHGTMHLSVGQEATATGAIFALNPEDYIVSTHRGHGHCIAKGADVKLMMAEFLGKETGYCRGRGGSMHIADLKAGNLGANGVVGSGIPIAVGAGLAIKLQKENRVVLCFFGDGAANTGAFHESLNMAAIWRVPVIFLCENNLYAMSTPVSKAFPIENIADRASAYGIPGVVVDGNDFFAVYKATKSAAERARRGEGPTLIECKTYRWKGHSRSDPQRYRSKEEIEIWKRKDPIARFKEVLVLKGIITEKEALDIEEEAKKAIEEAVRFALESPEPSPVNIEQEVYAQ
ncbi:MAG: pyruvate dehydrogenase (acetyl-transferring) E1 component subunit alpha [Candidatus Bathyarchaeia archaeon]